MPPRKKAAKLTPEEKREKRREKRRREEEERRAEIARIEREYWQPVDLRLDEEAFLLLPPVKDIVLLADLPKTTQPLDIFLRFLTPKILFAAWYFYPHDHWVYIDIATRSGTADLFRLYMVMACHIRIVGLHNTPKQAGHVEEVEEEKSLREALKECEAHFKSFRILRPVPSYWSMELMWCKFLIPDALFPSIYQNFEELLLQPELPKEGDRVHQKMLMEYILKNTMIVCKKLSYPREMKKDLGRYSLQPAQLNGGSKIPWNYCLELWNLRSYFSMEADRLI
eukprot:scaffold5782_cov185-Ochromonas_danica.AAC.4